MDPEFVNPKPLQSLENLANSTKPLHPKPPNPEVWTSGPGESGPGMCKAGQEPDSAATRLQAVGLCFGVQGLEFKLGKVTAEQHSTFQFRFPCYIRPYLYLRSQP